MTGNDRKISRAVAAIRAAAAGYVEEGFSIFPVKPDSKKPMIPEWERPHSQTARKIATWFKPKKGQHLPMVGLATGWVNKVKSPVFVLSVDDGMGRKALWDMEEAAGSPLPATRAVLTPDMISQYHFLLPPNVEIDTAANEVAYGIDILGQGGRVIMPPSVDNRGRVFKWLPGGDIFPVLPPDWVLDRFGVRAVSIQVPDAITPVGERGPAGQEIDVVQVPVAEPLPSVDTGLVPVIEAGGVTSVVTIQEPAAVDVGIPATQPQIDDLEQSKLCMDAARLYISRGWSIHPVHTTTDKSSRNYKKPEITAWQKPHPQDFTNPLWLEKYWGGAKDQPIQMIGIATGHISGFFVLDVDCGDGKVGLQSLARLQDKYGALPATLTVRSPSGGYHYYFKMPSDPSIVIPDSQGKIGTNLDIRGDGGQIIAPPSMTDKGGRYSYEAPSVAIADVDDWFIELVKKPSFKTPIPDNDFRKVPSAVKGAPLHWWVRAATDRLITELGETPEGERDNAVFSRSIRAGEFIKGGLIHYDDIRPRLVWASQQNGVYYDNPEKYEDTIDRGLEQGMTTGTAVEIPPECLNSTKEQYHVSTANISSESYSLNAPADGQNAHETSTEAGAASQGSEQKEISLPPVPLDAFPVPLQKVIEDAAAAFYCPVEIPVAAVLSFLSVAVGGSRHLRVKRRHEAHAVLWIATVGESGIGKSPCTNEILRPLHRLEDLYNDEDEKVIADYNTKKDEYALALRAYKSAVLKGKTGAIKPEEPAPVTYRRIFVDDITTEGIVKILKDNPKGVFMQGDELSRILFDMDKYTKGSGGCKARLLSSQDGGKWLIDRADTSKKAKIKKTWIGISGTIQPGILDRAFTKADLKSGFLPRFILIRAVRKKVSVYTDHEFSQQSEDTLQTLVDRLAKLQPTLGDSGQEWGGDYVSLTKPAYTLWKTWRNQIAADVFYEMGASSDENTLLTKTVGRTLSVCLLLTLADAAFENRNMDGLVATEDQMRRAIQIGEWLHQHYKASIAAFMGTEQKHELPLVQAIRKAIKGKWVDENGGWYVSTADLTDFVNQELGTSTAKVSSRIVGRASERLGLIPARKMTCRGWRVTREVFDKITRNIVNETGTIGEDTQKSGDSQTLNGHDVMTSHDVTEKSDFIAGDCCGSKAHDVNDVNDVSFIDKMKNTPGDFFDDLPGVGGNIEENTINNQFDGLLANDPDPFNTPK
jgi:hypothetical protein